MTCPKCGATMEPVYEYPGSGDFTVHVYACHKCKHQEVVTVPDKKKQ